ncbi:MAG: glycosyltransferase family 39 protein [Cellulomonas sp.]|nr:glycosyltransferase family 39 protein [Cellulomonas sp.]
MTATMRPIDPPTAGRGVGRPVDPVPAVSAGPVRVRPRWEVPAFVALLVVTAALNLWNLSSSGYANSFYSAAVQAGSTSWSAFVWGASDAGGSITVDKPPAALWVMALSVRVFGLSSWSILVPQALMGVGTVALLYRTVRRRFTAGAALLAGAALALTPVAALMFRFNNPDALLVLLLTASVGATMRAIEGPRTTRWMVLAGVLIGVAFLTKQLQAFLVLPGLAAAYLWAGQLGPAKRIRDGLLAVGAMVLAGGWWVALVELWPKDSRPYIGGSTDNSFLELTFGYNGLGRITGDETGSVGGGAGPGAWGSTGVTRLFSPEIGGQIAWLIPAALVLGAVAFWLLRRAPRTDAWRAQIVVWGTWLAVTGVVFSFMAGIFHAYYTVALAPAVAALVGIGAAEVWARRDRLWALLVLAVVTLGTAGWSVVVLSWSSDFLPWLRVVVLLAGLAGAAAMLAGHWFGRRLMLAGAGLALVAGLVGPTAYTLDTISTGHTGSIVTAGPTVQSSSRGGMGGGGMGGGPGGKGGPGGPAGTQTGTQRGPNGQAGPGGQAGAQGGPGAQTGAAADGTSGGTVAGGGPVGGLLDGTTVSTQVQALLEADVDSYTWVAATIGSQNAASYQLATQASVMPIGGFNGTDASPTLEQFEAWVSEGRIHYFIASDGMSGSADARAIAAWVEQSFTARTVDGTTLYDLSGGTTS